MAIIQHQTASVDNLEIHLYANLYVVSDVVDERKSMFRLNYEFGFSWSSSQGGCVIQRSISISITDRTRPNLVFVILTNTPLNDYTLQVFIIFWLMLSQILEGHERYWRFLWNNRFYRILSFTKCPLWLTETGELEDARKIRIASSYYPAVKLPFCIYLSSLT